MFSNLIVNWLWSTGNTTYLKDDGAWTAAIDEYCVGVISSSSGASWMSGAVLERLYYKEYRDCSGSSIVS